MSDPDPLDTIGVLRVHLEGTLNVLKSAYGYHMAADLQKQYESMRPNPKSSALTMQLNNLIIQHEDYLSVVESQEDGDTD